MSDDTKRRQHGVTLVEMMVGMGVVSFILLGTFAVTTTVRDGARATALLTKLDVESSRTLDSLAADLMQGGLETLTPPAAGDSTIAFRRCRGFAGGNLVWGPQITVTLEYEPEDPDDGIDNDGDGLVDECRIVRRTDPGGPGETVVVLAKGIREFAAGEDEDGIDNDGDGLIDERGLSFELDDNTLSVDITVEGWTEVTGTLMQSVSTSITFRN